MSTVKKYLSLIKFSHTIFAMPFAMIGFMLAAAWNDQRPFWVVVRAKSLMKVGALPMEHRYEPLRNK